MTDCNPIEQQAVQDRLEQLYTDDGRHDPAHPMHCLYTGLVAGQEQEVTDALADEPAVPAPPADGEVARLVAALRNQYRWTQLTDGQLDRIAELLLLLQRQALVPVSVSERLPGPEDCDDQGMCWWLVPNRPWPSHYLMMANSGLGADMATHWLPAHALPLPEVKA